MSNRYTVIIQRRMTQTNSDKEEGVLVGFHDSGRQHDLCDAIVAAVRDLVASGKEEDDDPSMDVVEILADAIYTATHECLGVKRGPGKRDEVAAVENLKDGVGRLVLAREYRRYPKG